MKKLKLPALLLALSLLAGCAAAPQGETPDELENDYTYQAAGLKQDFPLLTVDGEAVEAEEYFFWLVNSIKTWSTHGMLASDEAWASNATAMKEDALEVAILYQVIENKAKELGVTVDEAQIQADFDAAVAETGGEEILQAQLDSMAISWEGYQRLNRVYYLNQAILARAAETGEIEGKTLDSFLEENDIYGAKHILIATRRVNEAGTAYEEYSEEEKQKAYQLALNLRQRLLDENDSEEIFDELMNEFSEDGRDPNTGELYAPDGYTYVHSGEMVPEFEQGALALKVGQVGDIVPTDYGYHIILRIPADREQGVQEMLSMMIQQWMDEAEAVTDPAYDTIDPKDFYEKLNAINAERHPQPEESAPAESGNELQ